MTPDEFVYALADKVTQQSIDRIMEAINAPVRDVTVARTLDGAVTLTGTDGRGITIPPLIVDEIIRLMQAPVTASPIRVYPEGCGFWYKCGCGVSDGSWDTAALAGDAGRAHLRSSHSEDPTRE